jgi:hypothetical protein
VSTSFSARPAELSHTNATLEPLPDTLAPVQPRQSLDELASFRFGQAQIVKTLEGIAYVERNGASETRFASQRTP